MPPAPRAAPATPEGTRANRISWMVAPRPRDTNGNGFPDLIELDVYLFSTEYPTPFHEDGAFVFELYLGGQVDVAGAAPLNSWRIEGADLEAAKRTPSIIGPRYSVKLSLLEGKNPTDRYPRLAADLIARFEPADGRAAVVRRETHRLQIGGAVSEEES